MPCVVLGEKMKNPEVLLWIRVNFSRSEFCIRAYASRESLSWLDGHNLEFEFCRGESYCRDTFCGEL